MDDFKVIKQYLEEHIMDPLPHYIYLREIESRDEHDEALISLYDKIRESKWYKQLEEEMYEDGSFGRFHSMDSKDKRKRAFKTTEEAVRRMKDLGLTDHDILVQKVCKIMRKYATGEANWSDRHEKHYGFEIALNSMVGANMALLGDSSQVTQRYKKLCAFYIEDAFAGGDLFDIDIWTKKNHSNYDFMLRPWTIHILWLLYDNTYISNITLHKFLIFLLNRDEGIYYLYDTKVSGLVDIEDKHFLKWLHALENISRLSIFTNLWKDETRIHLIRQAVKLMNKEAVVPMRSPLIGHYHESWKKEELCRCDIVLRIARVIQNLID